MFDDQKTPSNLPMDKEPAPIPGKELQSGEPDDIFKDVEPTKNLSGMGAPIGRPTMQYNPERIMSKSPVASPAVPTMDAEIKPPLIASKKVIIILGVILGVLVVVGVVFSAMRFVQRSAQDQTVEPTAESNINTDVPALPEIPTADQEDNSVNTLPVDTATLDTDGDGLTDQEEMDLGTNLQNSDSDNDGLFDGEEVQTYKTDPLNPDTDKDGFLDGAEVSNNYNPKGAGRLLEIPAQ